MEEGNPFFVKEEDSEDGGLCFDDSIYFSKLSPKRLESEDSENRETDSDVKCKINYLNLFSRET